jgi:hypothetical protein
MANSDDGVVARPEADRVQLPPGDRRQCPDLEPPARRRMNGWVTVLLIAVALIPVLSLLFSAIAKVREASNRAHSQCNLKQLGIGFHNIASVYNGLEPPVVGRFPSDGPDSTIFYHLLPHIEQDMIYRCSPAGITRRNGTVPVYRAPADSSNRDSGAAVWCTGVDLGTHTLLTSYCANGAIFDGQHGGTVRFPRAFNAKGTTDCVLVFERFAAPNSAPREWNDPAPHRVWLYSPHDGGGGFDAFPYDTPPADAAVESGFFDRFGNDGEVDFGKRPVSVSHVNKPHAFNEASINVLLGDGSARAVSTSANATFDVDGRPVRIWAWACSVRGVNGGTTTPSGW